MVPFFVALVAFSPLLMLAECAAPEGGRGPDAGVAPDGARRPAVDAASDGDRSAQGDAASDSGRGLDAEPPASPHGAGVLAPMPRFFPSAALEPNATHLFPTRDGYVAFYESRPDVYSVVALDKDLKAIGAAQRVQVTDCVSAVPIGGKIVVAFGRGRNRGEDAEPSMDDLSVWTYTPESGQLEQTFLLPKQAVLSHAGPRILPHRDGTFSVLWGTYGGYVKSQSFDASARSVGGVVRSPSYGGGSAFALAIVPRGDAHMGILAAQKNVVGPRALLLLPRLAQGSFPASKPLVDDIGDGWPQLAALPSSAKNVGVVWHSDNEKRIWFGRVNESGLVGKPLLVRETETASTMKIFVAGEDGLMLLWNELGKGHRLVTFTEDGRMKSPPRSVSISFIKKPALLWTGSDWLFAEARRNECPLQVGRVSKGLDEVLDDKCAF